jgi:hypothetical protein
MLSSGVATSREGRRSPRSGRKESSSQKVASLHCGSTMSQGNSRANGISDRESNSQPNWEDDHQNIGHRPLVLSTNRRSRPPTDAAFIFSAVCCFLDRLDSNSENS